MKIGDFVRVHNESGMMAEEYYRYIGLESKIIGVSEHSGYLLENRIPFDPILLKKIEGHTIGCIFDIDL